MIEIEMAEPKMTETKIVENEMAETKIVENEMAETKIVENEMAEAKIIETQMAETETDDSLTASTLKDDGNLSDSSQNSEIYIEINPRAHVQTNSNGLTNFRIQDIGLANKGRMLMQMAYNKMPVFKKFVALERKQLLRGIPVLVCVNLDARTGIQVETLKAIGADVRVIGSYIRSTDNAIAAGLVENNIVVYGWNMMNLNDFNWCANMVLNNGRWIPKLILDDGGFLLDFMERSYSPKVKEIRGIVEQNCDTFFKISEACLKGKLLIPVVDVSLSYLKSKINFNRLYFTRPTIIDTLKKLGIDKPAGRTVLICGYHPKAMESAFLLKNCGAKVFIGESRPIKAFQACIDGFHVVSIQSKIPDADIVIIATNQSKWFGLAQASQMKNDSTLINMGDIIDEISIDEILKYGTLNQSSNQEYETILFGNGKTITLLNKEKDTEMNPRVPYIESSFLCISQIIALCDLCNNVDYQPYEPRVHSLCTRLLEFVCKLHLSVFNATLSDEPPHLIENIEDILIKENVRYISRRYTNI